MAENKIDSAVIGNMEGTIQDFSVPSETTDGPMDQKETTYVNRDWPEQFGLYKNMPELKSSIDAKADWVVGTGFKGNEITEIALSAIKGIGVDTFNTILANQMTVAEIGGDSFAEVILIDEILANLKPLNPEFIQIVADSKGLIIRYEQLDRVTKKKVRTFEPEQIFHLSRDRVADEIHGVSVIDAVKETIIILNEAITDYRKLLHRNVYPVKVWQVDTDDATEIAAFQVKADLASTQGENLIIPKGVVEPPVITGVAPNSTLNPLPWINQQTQKFYQIVGTPQIVVGGAQEITESAGKIVILAWEQRVKSKQLYIEEQVLSQLNIEINLEYPVTLQNELLSNMSKEETAQASTPEDTSVTNVGVTNAA